MAIRISFPQLTGSLMTPAVLDGHAKSPHHFGRDQLISGASCLFFLSRNFKISSRRLVFSIIVNLIIKIVDLNIFNDIKKIVDLYVFNVIKYEIRRLIFVSAYKKDHFCRI